MCMDTMSFQIDKKCVSQGTLLLKLKEGSKIESSFDMIEGYLF